MVLRLCSGGTTSDGRFFCAARETRTLMGLLPLAPKASVSTIPPSRHVFTPLSLLWLLFLQEMRAAARLLL